MQRRKFLQIFGIGLGAAAIPTATAAKAALTPPAETPTEPYPALGSTPRAPELPAAPITIKGDALRFQQHHPNSLINYTDLENKKGVFLIIAPGQTAHLINTTTGNIRAIPGPWCGSLNPDEALLDFRPESIAIPKSLQRLISQCAREQVHAMNGDDCGSHEFDKADNARFWQRLADQHINDIEEEAQILGLDTTWPGIYPEFTRPSPQTCFLKGAQARIDELEEELHKRPKKLENWQPLPIRD